MIYLKACPKCKGDTYPDEDVFGEYLKCLQCGHEVDDYSSVEMLNNSSICVKGVIN